MPQSLSPSNALRVPSPRRWSLGQAPPEAKPALVERARKALRAGELRSPTDIADLAKLLFGVSIPTEKFCPGCNPPAWFLAALVLPHPKEVLAWGPRGGGKTTIKAIADVLVMLLYPGVELRHSGATLRQARIAIATAKRCLHQPGIVDRFLAIQDETAWSVRTREGSELQVIVATEHGFSAEHPEGVGYDEVDQMKPFLVEQVAAGLSMRGSTGYGPKDGYASTRVMKGRMVDNLRRRAERTGRPFLVKWCQWEALAPCTYDAPSKTWDRPGELRSCAGCPAELRCAGRARGAKGWQSVQGFIDKIMRIPDAAWVAQFLNGEPSTEFLVYGMFDPALHLRGRKDGRRALRPWPDVPMWASLDLGYEHPMAGHLLQVRVPRLAKSPPTGLVFAEFYERGKQVEDFCSWLDETWPKVGKKPWAIVYDEARPDLGERIARLGWQAFPCDKSNDWVTNLGVIRGLLRGSDGKPHLFLEADETLNLQREFGSYEYRTAPDGSILWSEAPKKQDDDACDSARYGFMAALQSVAWI